MMSNQNNVRMLNPSVLLPDSDQDARWQAVLDKDAELDGEFVFAVKTTGIYCRPSCPARLAKRQNVAFFDTTLAAEAAGFRACKRCRPAEVAPRLVQQDLILVACRTIETRSPSEATLDKLAEQAGLSSYHFHRLFKEVTGVTPGAYRRALAQRRLANVLPQSTSVTEAIYDAGFNSSSRFYEAAKALPGLSPSDRVMRGARQVIHYAVTPCALGFVLVAATDKGLCAIEFDDSPARLTEGLKARFTTAELAPASVPFQQWVDQILAHLAQPATRLNLPMDVQGTAFQHRVWQALQAIPAGQTATYTDIAKALGTPAAVRAVAKACASNRLAVLIPCHRVIRLDGHLAGYRWGVERKAELLRREQVG